MLPGTLGPPFWTNMLRVCRRKLPLRPEVGGGGGTWSIDGEAISTKPPLLPRGEANRNIHQQM